jgi:hypothetical protein
MQKLLRDKNSVPTNPLISPGDPLPSDWILASDLEKIKLDMFYSS